MSNLVVIGFENEADAFEMRAALARMQREYLIEMEDAVVVTRDAKGKAQLHQPVSLAGAGAASSEGAVSGLAGGFLGATGSGRVTPICQMASPHRLRQLLWLREAPPEAFLAVQLRERTPSQPCDRACRFRAPKMPCVEVGPTVRTRRRASPHVARRALLATKVIEASYTSRFAPDCSPIGESRCVAVRLCAGACGCRAAMLP